MSSQQDTEDQNAVPAWGSYLYQNFLLPALSPNIATDWLTSNSPFANTTQPVDYFNYGGQQPKVEQQQQQQSVQIQQQWSLNATAGPSTYYQQPMYQTAIPTSLLMPGYLPPAPAPAESTNISPSIDLIDAVITTSPSPIGVQPTPQMSPKRGAKRRAESLDSEEHTEHEHEVPEGVERDGMIWGMKVEDYRALSARERKRVRNRISARTFRAKRKGMSCSFALHSQFQADMQSTFHL
jgi:hypothetical protein